MSVGKGRPDRSLSVTLWRLPPGSYTVEAEHEDEVTTRRIDVAAGRNDRPGFEGQ